MNTKVWLIQVPRGTGIKGVYVAKVEYSWVLLHRLANKQDDDYLLKEQNPEKIDFKYNYNFVCQWKLSSKEETVIYEGKEELNKWCSWEGERKR